MIEQEKSKKLDLLKPIINILNSILSLNSKKAFKDIQRRNDDEANNINVLLSFDDEMKYCFKVLVLDEPTFNFISPFIKISSLKKNNICLTTKLNCKKDKMDNIMAIYLVTPSLDNFKLILDDMKQNIYQNYSINFIEKPDDNLFEEFLSNIIKLNNYKNIYNLHVFPMKYSLLHPKITDFCTLDKQISQPYKLYNLNLKDKNTDNYYNLIANMIFNCLFCMKMSPRIRYRNGSIMELIVKKINLKFLSTFNKFPNLKNDFKNGDCLLILLERDLLDIPIMFHHPSTYGAIINDICGVSFENEKNKKSEKKIFNLDPLNDFIWNEQLINPYHEVGDETLLKYKKYDEQMKIFRQDNKTNNLDDLADKSEKLADSIKCIDTKIIEGDILDKHANMFPYLNKNIEERHLAEIYLIEKKILDGREITKEINDNITQMVNEGKINKNNQLDLFRLCLIYLLIDKDFQNDKFIKDIMYKLSLPPPFNLKAIVEYFDTIKKGSREHNPNLMNELNKGNEESTMLKKMGGVTKSLFKKGFNLIKKAVKNFRSKSESSITKNILIDLVYGNLNDFNSIQINSDIVEQMKKSTYQNIFLFIFGGGSFNEYEYCKEIMDEYKFNFIYGADKIYSPVEFLEEINEIAISDMNNNNN